MNTKTTKPHTKTPAIKTSPANSELRQPSPDNAEVMTSPKASIQREGETDAQITQIQQPNDLALAGESDNEHSPVAESISDENHINEGQTNAADESLDASEPNDDVAIVLQAPQHSEADAAPDAHTVETVTARAQPPRKAIRRQKQDFGPAFNKAREDVARLRKELLEALDEKAALLGSQRVGEAVPLRHTNSAIGQIDLEIQRVATELAALRQRKSELMAGLVANVEDLEMVNRKIRRITMEREIARSEKKRAYQKATTESTQL